MNEKIYTKLKKKILFLDLEPGEVIDEKKLAAEFKVSRTPVREVLQRLEWEGFIEIIPRGLISISILEYTRLKNTYILRVQMESLAGKLAATNGYPKHIAQLSGILDNILMTKEEMTLLELIDFDSAFRGVLYDAAGNPVLKQISDNLYEQTFRVWMSHIKNDASNATLQRDIDLLIEEIRAAIETIEAKDLDAGESRRRNIFLLEIKLTTEKFFNEIEMF